MEKEKLFGYVLLFSGLGVILYCALSAYQVFTNQTEPINLFTFDSIKLDLAKMIDAPVNTELTQELIKPEMINKPMNLAAHLFLMGFLASIGAKIANIGALLVRPIKVTLKENLIGGDKSKPD